MRWRNRYSRCLVCASIPGQPHRTCRWFGETAVGALAPEPGADGDDVAPSEEDGHAPLLEADEAQPGKMSKAEEAHTEAHMRAHKPFNPYSDICVRAESRNKKAHRNAFQREVDHFVQVITLDHWTTPTFWTKNSNLGSSGPRIAGRSWTFTQGSRMVTP